MVKYNHRKKKTLHRCQLFWPDWKPVCPVEVSAPALEGRLEAGCETGGREVTLTDRWTWTKEMHHKNSLFPSHIVKMVFLLLCTSEGSDKDFFLVVKLLTWQNICDPYSNRHAKLLGKLWDKKWRHSLGGHLISSVFLKLCLYRIYILTAEGLLSDINDLKMHFKLQKASVIWKVLAVWNAKPFSSTATLPWLP